MAKILIADDSMFMRRVLKGILTSESADTYDVVEADSGPAPSSSSRNRSRTWSCWT